MFSLIDSIASISSLMSAWLLVSKSVASAAIEVSLSSLIICGSILFLMRIPTSVCILSFAQYQA